MEKYKDYSQSCHYQSEGFSPAVDVMLIRAKADRYTDMFRKQNISIQDISEFTDTDLIILGVDSEQVRHEILDEIAALPETYKPVAHNDNLTQNDAESILHNSKQELVKIYVNFLFDRSLLCRTKQINDLILRYSPECYATDVILNCFNSIEYLINDMEQKLNKLHKKSSNKHRKFTKKKLFVLTFGGTIITLLSFALINSIKKL